MYRGGLADDRTNAVSFDDAPNKEGYASNWHDNRLDSE